MPHKDPEVRREWYRAWRERTKGRRKAQRPIAEKRWHRTSWEQSILRIIKSRAKTRGLEFNLTVKDIVVPTHCPVLGIPLIVGAPRKDGNSPSVDRKDNALGYIPENICVISLRANTLKNNATIEELERVLIYMKDNEF